MENIDLLNSNLFASRPSIYREGVEEEASGKTIFVQEVENMVHFTKKMAKEMGQWSVLMKENGSKQLLSSLEGVTDITSTYLEALKKYRENSASDFDGEAIDASIESQDKVIAKYEAKIEGIDRELNAFLFSHPEYGVRKRALEAQLSATKTERASLKAEKGSAEAQQGRINQDDPNSLEALRPSFHAMQAQQLSNTIARCSRLITEKKHLIGQLEGEIGTILSNQNAFIASHPIYGIKKNELLKKLSEGKRTGSVLNSLKERNDGVKPNRHYNLIESSLLKVKESVADHKESAHKVDLKNRYDVWKKETLERGGLTARISASVAALFAQIAMFGLIAKSALLVGALSSFALPLSVVLIYSLSKKPCKSSDFKSFDRKRDVTHLKQYLVENVNILENLNSKEKISA